MPRASSTRLSDEPNSSLPFDGRLGASINETATALNLQRDNIYRLVADGRLTVSKLGRRTIVHVTSIHRLLVDTVVKPRPRVRHSRRGGTQRSDPTA